MKSLGKSNYKKMAKKFHGQTAGKVINAAMPESVSKGGKKAMKFGK